MTSPAFRWGLSRPRIAPRKEVWKRELKEIPAKARRLGGKRPPTRIWPGFEGRPAADILATAMTATPWGDSEELRDRMLVSGRVSPATAAQSQRERLFGAIVASCAERGYEATRISDLASLSGVSRRDFYRRFANKEACFLDALDALLAMGEGAAAGHYDGRGGGLEVLIKVCATQPAAARFCLLESYVAGEAAVARMDAAVAEAATLFEAALKAIGGDGTMPREVVPADHRRVRRAGRRAGLSGDDD